MRENQRDGSNKNTPSTTISSSPEIRELRLLSYNIQAGIETDKYRHYITKSWQHVLPSSKRIHNLHRIANTVKDFDIVALQEADGGSLRSGFINQAKFLAHAANFPYWYQQNNRNVGRIAQSGNGLLSRYEPYRLEDHRLPATIPGRGAIIAFYGSPNRPLVFVLLHLSLGQRAQRRQLAYIHEIIQSHTDIILMGDLNCQLETLIAKSRLKHMDLLLPDVNQAPTFPSWRPLRAIDHILVSPSITINQVTVLPHSISDHLPIAMDIKIS